MRSGSNELWKLNNDGEIIYQKLNADTKMKYAPDTPFFRSVVPYFMLALCGLTDFFVFKSMFDMVSYDNNIMKVFSIAGLLIGFDVIPIFIGVQARRVRQGFSRDRFVLFIALAVSLIAVALNFGLRAATVDEMSPAVSAGQSFLGTAPETAADTGTDPTALALTLFGCFLPIVTSVASFVVSYLTYDPLMIRKQRTEMLLREKQDEVRRFDAVIYDYEADSDFPQRLDSEDEGKYREMLKLQRAKVISYCDYVRERLKEELANPTSNNALSTDDYESILQRLDAELAALDDIERPSKYPKASKMDWSHDSMKEAIAS